MIRSHTTNNRYRIVVLWSILFLLVSYRSGIVSAQAQQLKCSPSETAKYEWENWSYYQLLELNPPKSASLEPKEIRRAYRKQAQLWHPDKHVNHNGSKKKKMSIDECTARFAKIAEAYEVLSDEKKREEYHLFLQHCRAEEKSSSRWSFRFEKFMDPMQVFEELFFGKSKQEQAVPEDAYSTFFKEGGESGKNQPQPRGKPLRSYRHEEYLQDPYTGKEIIRRMQTEEYASADPTTGKFFFRTHAQEFEKTFDPFTGMSYFPVASPYLLDEGYRYPSESHQGRSSKRGGGSSPTQDAQTILFPGDVLTPRSTLLVSPNKRYYAGLSPECELLVTADNGNAGDDAIWSSRIPKRMHHSSRCFATLRGPHLVVGMERPGQNHQVLWFSEATDDEADVDGHFSHHQRQQQHHSTYLAQLDNDGSLVVYKVWNVPRKYYTLAERAWITAGNFLKGQTRAEYDVLYSPFVLTYRKCVYATGPLGCFRVARRLYELSLSIYYTIKGIIHKVDQKLDAFMELVLEEDDFVRAFQRSLYRNGSSIGTKSARLMRKVMQYFLVNTKG